MKKTTLKNDLILILEKKPTDSVSIQVTVKTGSNKETKRISGISHFIEHMLFEATKNRPNARIISNEIESVGGILNAYTSNERTCFFVKVPKKHLSRALDLLSDIIKNPLFKKEHIEKERKIILKEINLHKDEPRFHQWVLFGKALFKKHPAKNPTYGAVNAVKNIKQKDILHYYKKHYIASNMVVSVVGDIHNINQIKGYFEDINEKKQATGPKIKEPPNKHTVKKERRKILNSYMVLGYKAVPRKSKDSYVLDVIRAILGRGQSGRLFDEIRGKRGLAYEVGVLHEPLADYGFFSVYLNTDKKNIKKIVSIILNEFKKLDNLTKKELIEAKGFLEGQYILDKEDTQELADELGFWEYIGDVGLMKDYLKNISKVNKKDIIRVAKRYLTRNYTLAVIEQS